MAKPPFERVEELFHRSVALPRPERSAYLERQCGSDSVLRAAVEALLQHDVDDTECGFLISPLARARSDEPEVLPSVAGYDVLAELGRGGMGVVYKALQHGLHRLVALKMLHAGLPAVPDLMARFRKEAEALARVQHPNIVQVFEIHEDPNHPYFAMEYVPGPSLAAALVGSAWSPEASARLVEILARAMHAAHELGVIHRDLKPANVLLKRTPNAAATIVEASPWNELGVVGGETSFLWRGGRCEPKVTDFGIAKDCTARESLTRTGDVLGTPAYMAPEQASARPVGPATDIYSLGVILYELLTGHPPFSGSTALEIAQRVTSEEPLPPRRSRPRVPRDLQTICLKCLEKAPPRRYASARALAEDLQRFRSGIPIHARPLGPIGRVGRWCRRRPLVAALWALVGMLAMALVATAAVYQVHLERALAENRRLEAAEHRQLVDLNITLGMDKAEEEDPLAALLWFTEALRMEAEREGNQRHHRMRIATTLRQCPQLQAFVPTGERVLATSWTLAPENARRAPLAGVAPSNARVATDAGSGRIHVYAPAQSPTPVSEYQVGSPPQNSVFSPDGDLLATSLADGRVGICRLVNGRSDIAAFRQQGPFDRLAISTGGERLLVRRPDHTIQIWDIATRRQIDLPEAWSRPATFADFSDDGRWLVRSSAGDEAQVWNILRQKQIGRTVRFSGPLTRATFSADGGLVALGTRRGTQIWNVGSGQLLGKPGPYEPEHLLFSPDGKRLLAAGDTQPAHIEPVDTSEPVVALALDSSLERARFTADGTRLVTLGSNGHARVWDPRTGQPLTPVISDAAGVFDVLPDPRGEMLLSVSKEGTIRVWRLHGSESSQANAPVLPSSPSPSLDARFTLRPRDASTWQLMESANGAPLGTPLRHGGPLRLLCLSPDGSRILTAGDDSTAQLWDAKTGLRQAPPLRHKGPIRHASFSPDGTCLITGSDDQSARVWDTATGVPLTPPLRHQARVVKVAFSSAGDRAIVDTTDGASYAWDLSPDEQAIDVIACQTACLSGRAVGDHEELYPLDASALRTAWSQWHASRSR